MSWSDIAVIPAGPVFFGDGRPLAAGETDYGAGRFPPSPRTMQGLVRTALLNAVPGLDLTPGRERERIAALIGTPEALPEGWRIVGPWLARWRENERGVQAIEPWLPLPHSVVTAGGGQGLAFLTPHSLADGMMRWDCQALALALCADGRAAKGYVSPAGLRRLLSGELPEVADIAPLPPFVREERRTGLALEQGQDIASEGMLYTLGFRRFADEAGFVLRFQGQLHERLDQRALTQGRVALGGRNRVARLRRCEDWSDDFKRCLGVGHLPEKIAKECERFWLVSTTPVVTTRPFSPAFSPSSLGGAKAEIVAAAAGAVGMTGGFSLAEGHGTATGACLPAGSSWLVEIGGGTETERADLARALHETGSLGDDSSLNAMGFGHCLLARAPAKGSAS